MAYMYMPTSHDHIILSKTERYENTEAKKVC